MDAASHGAERYRRLSLEPPAGKDIRGNEMHHEERTGMMSIMNSMYGLQRWEKKGCQTDGFKVAVMQWCSAYALAYSLMMTIAFTMLTSRPGREAEASAYGSWKPQSEMADTAIFIAYYFFAAMACYDSAWGMLLTAEWGVRAGTVPGELYDRFIHHLEPDPSEAATKANTMWAFRFFEPRAVHPGLRTFGCFSSSRPDLHVGLSQQPSWDPFYFVDRTVISLFISAAMLVYLDSGALPAAFVAWFLLCLRSRVRDHGQVIVQALFRTYSEACEADGVAISDSEANVTGQNRTTAERQWVTSGAAVSAAATLTAAVARSRTNSAASAAGDERYDPEAATGAPAQAPATPAAATPASTPAPKARTGVVAAVLGRGKSGRSHNNSGPSKGAAADAEHRCSSYC